MLPCRRGKAKPAIAEDSEHVTVCEQYDIALDVADFLDYAIDPRSDLFWLLSTRTAISNDEPARGHRVDLVRRQSLIAPIVPLDQVRLNVGHAPKAGEPTRLLGRLQRTCQGQGERFLR